MGNDAPDGREAPQEKDADLRNAEARYRAVVEAVDAAIFVFQGNRTIELNQAAERLAGRTRAELLAMNFWNVVHPDDRAMVRSRGMARLQGERVAPQYRVRVMQPDGAVRWVDYKARPVVFGGGAAVLGVALDITDSLQTAERLRANQEELAHVQRLGSAEALTAGLAHELQQPLAAVVAMAGAGLRSLRAGAADKGRLIEIMEETARLGLHAGDMVRRIYDFTQKRVRQPEQVEPAELVSSALELFSREDRERLRSDVTDEIATVTGDPVQLRQVLVNLLQNAIEAGCASGEPEPVDIQGRIDNGAVVLSVLDRGTGISPEQADEVFDAFSSTKPTGMGLGLSICRSIAEAHGGRLWFTPRPGGGTCFHFSLPADR